MNTYLNSLMTQVPNIQHFYGYRVLLQRESDTESLTNKEVSVSRTSCRIR
jgi:hypothetical protein